MFVDTLLAFVIVRYMWKRPNWRAAWALGAFGVLDLVFVWLEPAEDPAGAPGCRWCSARCWSSIMWTWTRGAQILAEKTRRGRVPLLELIEILQGPRPAPGARHGHLPHLGSGHGARSP